MSRHASNKSFKVSVRLNPEEFEMLQRIKNSEIARNASEVFRMLLRRDFQKRGKGSAKVPDRLISSEHRRGRPSKILNENV